MTGRTVSMAMRSLSDRGSSALDLLRGLSALAVMLGHVRGLFFVPLAGVPSPGAAVYFLYILTSFGHEAVIVFFVLSGYLIGRNVLRSVADGSWSFHSYLVRRLTRLSIVLIPALIVGALIDLGGVNLFDTAGPYGDDPSYRHVVDDVVADRLHLSIFFGNAAYLQDILVPTFGSNGSLWSLSYEFWFYLMFPCAVLALTRGSGTSRRLLYAGLSLATAIFLGPEILGFFLIWLLGAATIVAPPLNVRPRTWIAALGGTLALCLGVAALYKSDAMPDVAADVLLALSIAMLVYILANCPGATARGTWERLRLPGISRGIAGFSYTLYLVHMPALIFLHAAVIWSGGARWQPDPAHAVAGICIAVLIVGYAWAFSRFTEAHTRQATASLLMIFVRNRIEK